MISRIPSGSTLRPAMLVAFFVLLLLLSCSKGASPTAPPADDRSAGGPQVDEMAGDNGDFQYAPGEVLVVLINKAPMVELVGMAADYDLLPVQVIDVPWGPLYRLQIRTGETVQQMVVRLNADSRVRYAEPNYVVKFLDAPYVPNDPMWERDDPGDDPRDSVYDQWGPAKSGAPIVWNDTKGSQETIVAILDTGIRFTHEDLYYQVWYNMDEITGNDIDDDSNGFVDDWIGWNFNNNNNNTFDNAWNVYYHGTACSGIVAAEQDNERGVSGIAPGVKVMAVKLNLNGWPESAFISSVVGGLQYAYENGASIASMSFGTASFSQSMKDACDYVYDNGNGMVLMASAGNSDADEYYYPSSYDSVIAVAAVCAFNEANDRMAEVRISGSSGFSWGSTWGDQLEISGYGDKYTTTYGEHYSAYWDGINDPGFFGGTSCACPMTAGVMALLKSYYPEQSALWLRDRLKLTCDDIHTVGWDDQSGYGRVNAVRAIWGSDRYSDLEDLEGFVEGQLPEARFHDCIHDVPGNPYYDVQDLYKFTPISDGVLRATCYIYNWGEDLDIALYSDSGLTGLLTDSTILNDPYNNVEEFFFPVSAEETYYLRVYSPAPGSSSLYDLSVSLRPGFDVVGYDIAPAFLPSGGQNVPFLRIECSSWNPATLSKLALSAYGTLPLGNISKIELYDDTNESGEFDPGDLLIGSSGVPVINRVVLSDLSVAISMSEPRTLFATADLVDPPGPRTFRLSIETYKDIVTSEGYQAPYWRLPITSSICTVGN